MPHGLFIADDFANARHDLRYPFFHEETYRDMERTKLVLLTARALHFHEDWAYNRNMLIRDTKARFHRNMHSSDNALYRCSIHHFKILKRLTLKFAKIFQKGDEQEVAEILNEVRYFDVGLARRLRSVSPLCDDIYECDDCGEFVLEDGYQHVLRDRVVCETCIDECYRLSDCMDVYIKSNECYSVYNSTEAYYNERPDDICTYRYGANNFSEHDGVFFSNSDDYYEVCDSERDREDDDDDGSSSGTCIPAWHSAYRSFVTQNKSNKYPALGAELEIYVEEREDFASDAKRALDVVLERDGSIDDDYGVEIITHPLGREEWAEFSPKMFELIHEYDGIGYNDPAGDRYGIHLTIHRSHLSPLAEARIAMFLVDSQNANFVRAIAQRNQIYCPNNGIGISATHAPSVGHISTARREIFNPIKHKSENKIYGRGKYCPVNFKEDLAEFRIFQSTTNEASFQKNLEFVWALWKWTKPETASGCSHSYVDFLTWLNKRQQRKEFPALIRFLSKRVFYGTNFSPIISNWQSLMTKPNELEACEPMAA